VNIVYEVLSDQLMLMPTKHCNPSRTQTPDDAVGFNDGQKINGRIKDQFNLLLGGFSSLQLFLSVS
jgi:hypothetical protein